MPENSKSTKIPQKRVRKPYTAESTQTRIIAKKIAGKSNSEIAREEHVDRGTIRRILSRSEFQNIVQTHRQEVLDLVPLSIRLFEKALKTSLGEEAALETVVPSQEAIQVFDRDHLKAMLDAAFRRGVASGVDGMKAANETLKGMQVLVGKQEADVTIQDEVNGLTEEERQAKIAAYLKRLAP